MDDNQGPGIVAPPPVLFAGTLGLGFLAQALRPIQLLPDGLRPFRRVAGWAFTGSGALTAAWAFTTMRRAGNQVDVSSPVATLTTDGPYRYSRNPIYVGMTGLYLGATLLRNAGWPLVLLPALLTAMRRGVIQREERYLETRFGESYRDYMTRVRRWL